MPQHWQELHNDSVMIPCSFLGGGGGKRSACGSKNGSKGELDDSSCSSWLKPCESPAKVASVANSVKAKSSQSKASSSKSSWLKPRVSPSKEHTEIKENFNPEGAVSNKSERASSDHLSSWLRPLHTGTDKNTKDLDNQSALGTIEADLPQLDELVFS